MLSGKRRNTHLVTRNHPRSFVFHISGIHRATNSKSWLLIECSSDRIDSTSRSTTCQITTPRLTSAANALANRPQARSSRHNSRCKVYKKQLNPPTKHYLLGTNAAVVQIFGAIDMLLRDLYSYSAPVGGRLMGQSVHLAV